MKPHTRGLLKHLSLAVAALLGLALLTLFAWNSVVPDVFGLAPLRYKGALGLVLLTGTAGWLLGSAGRHARTARG